MIIKNEEDIINKWKGECKSPLVSICTITYNHSKYIEDTLDSFLIQETDFSYEIIIDDDASVDATSEIVTAYKKKYPNIIKPRLKEKNIGVMKNFSECLMRATGKYIAICEGDDYWVDPRKLQKQVDFLEKNDDFIITYSSVEAFDETGIISNYVGGAKRDLSSLELKKCHPINTLTVCFRNKVKKFPPEFYCTKFGDLFLWSLLGKYGKGKYLENIKPSKYRVHDGGVYSKESNKKELGYFTFLSLFLYYHRTGDIELSEFFHEKSIKCAFQVYGRLYYIKQLCSTIVDPKNKTMC